MKQTKINQDQTAWLESTLKPIQGQAMWDQLKKAFPRKTLTEGGKRILEGKNITP